MTPSFAALQAALQGRYRLEREIGRGGMGVVYLARDIALDRPVAVKLLPPHFAALPELRERFLREARTSARLSHPNIVPIFAVEAHGEVVCFVMAYVAGETLAERVRQQGPLGPAEVSRIVQEVAWALAYAHSQGVIHRDVKPENILLERGTGRALVTDFGIARLADQIPATPSSDVMGTPRLMSPEQAAGEPLDGRSDLYSLGVTAFFALTGRYPFDGDSAGQLLVQHLTMPPPPVSSLRPGLPRALAVAVDRCLGKSPEQRFATGEELAEALTQSGTAVPVPRALQRIVQELSNFAVDLAGYASVAAVAILTQILTPDFFDLGFTYTAGIVALILSLLALRGTGVSRLIRQASREGWTADDLAAAAAREAAESEQAAPSLRARLLLYVGGMAGLILVWLGPKQWAQNGHGFLFSLVAELLCLAMPVALGRWLGLALETPREGRPGLLTQFFLRFKSGALFRILGRGTKPPLRPEASVADQPTEVYLADQAREMLKALPPGERERLGGADDLLRRLERDAVGLRKRIGELDQAAAAVGGAGTPERRAVGETIAHSRQDAVERLGSAVSALETLRLELLRARVGLPATDGLTENLSALRRLTDQIDGAIEAGEG